VRNAERRRGEYTAQQVYGKRGEFIEFSWADEDIDDGHSSDEVDAIAFGEAAQDADDEGGVGFLAFFEFAQARPDFLLSAFADGAGVEEDDVGGVAVGSEAVPQSAELAGDEF